MLPTHPKTVPSLTLWSNCLRVHFGNVPVSVPTLRERLLAVHAAVRPLSRVHPHVHLQLVLPDEALVAARAHVWSVARVVALVHLQLRQAAVSPAALVTLVAGPHLHVVPAVEPEAAGRPEGLVALRALVGFLSGVRGAVQLEAGGRREAAAADGAQVRPLSGVQGPVFPQLVPVQEGLAADGAAQRLLTLVRAHVLPQLAQRGEGVVTPGAGVRSLFLELPVLEAVQLQLRLVLEGLNATAALMRPLLHVSPQVIPQCRCGGQDDLAVRAFGFTLAVGLGVTLVVGKLEEVLAAHRTVVALPVLVAFLMLAVRIRHLKILATGLAGVGLVVHLHVCLQVFGAAEGCVTFGTNAIVFLGVALQVLVQILGERKLPLAIRARVTFLAGLFVVAHNVPFQVIHATKAFAAIATFQASARMGLPVSSQFQPAAEAFRTFGAVVLALFVLVPHVSPHVVGLGEG